MTEEAAAEQVEAPQEEHVQQEAPPEEPKQVPLKALEEERRKRQDEARRAKEAEERYWRLQEQLEAAKKSQEPEEDEYTREMKQYVQSVVAQNTRTALEKQYLAQNPQCYDAIQNKLPSILEKKPWLAAGIQNAENRYQAAMEIINDFSPKDESQARKRLEENAKKPGNPAQSGKNSNLNHLEALKGMSRKEFSEYRAKLLGRRPNIR